MQNNINAAAEVFGNPKYFRADDGVYKRIESPWGSYYSKVPDPKGKPKPPELEEFQLNPNFAKLPGHLLQAIVTLFRQYLKSSHNKPKVKHQSHFQDDTTEVQVCLLRKEDNPDIWKVVVPKQVVGAVTVDAVLAESCDLLTGEEYTVFPPIGYIHAGSIHSHCDFACFWSGRDDRGELGVPGMHCTIGHLSQTHFGVCCSIVLNRRRYVVEPPYCLDLSVTKGAQAIPKDHCYSWIAQIDNVAISDKVHKYITKPQRRVFTPTTHTSSLNKGKSFLKDWSVSGHKTKKTGKVGKKTWEDWDAIDWAPRYNYDATQEANPVNMLDYLNSSGLRQELTYIMDLTYAASQRSYDDPNGNLTSEQKEALCTARDFLADLFESLCCYPGFELAVIDALACAYQLGEELSQEVIDALESLDN